MQEQTRKLLRSLGCELSHGMIERTHEHFAAASPPASEGVQPLRDLAYGPDARHRLDLFLPRVADSAPVILFVHGGGFVLGDKRLPGQPFYDNVGQWAASHGCIGVTMNYRLAPDHVWPAGAEDLGLAILWVKEHIAVHGGDPGNIVLMGQSSGAAHVASYLALPDAQPAKGPGVTGAVLVGGVYDPATAAPNPYHLAYYGMDRTCYADYSCVQGLVATNVPLCFVISEFDGIDYRRQMATLVGAFGRARGDLPRLHWLSGHNHLSPVLALGSDEDTLGPLILNFIQTLAEH